MSPAAACPVSCSGGEGGGGDGPSAVMVTGREMKGPCVPLK